MAQILIADSGSTKTDWCIASPGAIPQRMSTQGINPFYQTDEQITGILEDEAANDFFFAEEDIDDDYDPFFDD